MARRGRKKGDPTNTGNPDWDGSVLNTSTAFNKRAFAFRRAYRDMPVADLSDPKAVRRQIELFFEICEEYDMRPPVEAFCAVLGTTRGEVERTGEGQKTGLSMKLSPESAIEFQKGLEDLQVFIGAAVFNDAFKFPVNGIFLAKNLAGYKDESSTLVRHEAAAAGPSRAQLAAKYAAALPVEAEDVVVEEPKRLSK